MEQRVEIPRDFEDLAERLTQAAGLMADDLRDLGNYALVIIYERTANQHLDVRGAPFKAYSTIPWWVSEKDDYYYLAQKSGGEPRVTKYGKNKGRKYVFFRGGYRQFHVGLYGDERANLMKLHEMMGSMAAHSRPGGESGTGVPGLVPRGGAGDLVGAGFGVVACDTETVTLDFTRPRERQKAIWNEDMGREFWGIGQRTGEVEALADWLKEAVEERINAALAGSAIQ